jgi:hypothetical protein
VTEAPPTGAVLKEFIGKTWPAYQALTKELNLKLD